MIEIICKENQRRENDMEAEVHPPKNIRQVGSPRGRHKIYLEDYVYTYVRNAAQKEEACSAVLLGKSQVSRDIRYTFISGAIECGQAVFQWNPIQLDDSFWDYIYKEEKQYFGDTEIVGWFVGKKGQDMELSASLESAHRKYFAGRDKVLMLMDGMEQEEVFYVYEQGYLQKREGYYIYYEKNLPMQEYMVSKKEEESMVPKRPDEEEEPLWWGPESDRAGQQEPEKKPEQSGETEISVIRRELYQEVEREEKEQERQNDRKEQKKLEEQNGPKEQKEELRKEAGISQESAAKNAELRKEAEISQESAAKNAELRKEAEISQESAAKNAELQPEQSGNPAVPEAEWEQLHQEIEEALPEDKIFVKSSLEEPKSQAEQALRNYRSTLLEKQGTRVEKQNRKFLYTAASFFMVVICVIGVTTMNNYQKMKEVESTLQVMASSVEKGSGEQNEDSGKQKGTGETEEADKKLVVENIESQVQPLGQESPQGSQPQEGQPQGGQPADPAQQGQAPQESAPSQPQPEQPQPEQPQPQPEPQYYTVQDGDTMETICQKVYQDRSKVQQLCQANGIENGDKIFPGQKLLLP